MSSGAIFLFLLFIVSLLPGEPARAASVNLPLHHWGYEAIERMATLGLVDQTLVGTKPITREEMARIISRIIEGIEKEGRGSGITDERTEDLLVRLVEEFPAPAPLARFRFHWADPVSLEFSYTALKGEDRRLQENRRGELFPDGPRLQVGWRIWAEIGRHLVLAVTPVVRAEKGDTRLVLYEASLKVTIVNLEVEVGRDTLWWGPGYHGSLLLSDNVFPFDLIKVGSAEPFHLPWHFRRIGLWRVTAFLTRLERERPVPRSRLFGLRISLAPFSFLEVGVSRVTLFGGEGRPDLSVGDFFRLYFSKPNQSGKFEVNGIASLDARLRVPGLVWPVGEGMELYGEVGGEDEAGFFPTKKGYLVGAYLPGLAGGDTDLRVEYARNHVRGSPNVWYTHFFSLIPSRGTS